MKNSGNFEDKIKMAKDISEALKSGKNPAPNTVGLTDEKMNKIKKILNDEYALREIMESGTAKELLKKFGKE